MNNLIANSYMVKQFYLTPVQSAGVVEYTDWIFAEG